MVQRTCPRTPIRQANSTCIRLIRCYYRPMPKLRTIARATVEIAFILFLFYANLLMGEFTRSNGRGKSLAFALADIFTRENLLIGIAAAVVGYVVFEHLRKRL